MWQAVSAADLVDPTKRRRPVLKGVNIDFNQLVRNTAIRWINCSW
jgi:hypothetical protein